jgi:lysozyme family protein
MKGNFDRCFVELLKHEGGYSNHPQDKGGRTNLGVTQRVYEDWVGHPVTEKIMRGLTPQHVRALYKAKYWDVVKGDDLPAGVDLCVFDFAVNAGPNRAARYLQLMVGASADGRVGPNTLRQLQQYVAAHKLPHAVNRYQDLREAYYRKLKTFPTFGRGWLRRNAEVRQVALRMAA